MIFVSKSFLCFLLTQFSKISFQKRLSVPLIRFPGTVLQNLLLLHSAKVCFHSALDPLETPISCSNIVTMEDRTVNQIPSHNNPTHTKPYQTKPNHSIGKGQQEYAIPSQPSPAVYLWPFSISYLRLFNYLSPVKYHCNIKPYCNNAILGGRDCKPFSACFFEVFPYPLNLNKM